jgi:hypothetical protein
MNEKTKKPPEIKITVAVKFDEKIKYRQQVMNLAAEEADADVTFKCMKDHDEITFIKDVTNYEQLGIIDEAFEDVCGLIYALLKIQHLLDPKK